MSKRAKEKAELIANGIMISVQGKTGRVAYNTKEKSFTHYELMCAAQKGYEQAEKDLGWHSVKEMLPPIDEEVIVLTDDIHGTIVPGAHGICFGHRPNPDGWDGKSIETGEVKHYDVVTYDGWNIPGVTHWMHCPKLEEE